MSARRPFRIRPAGPVLLSAVLLTGMIPLARAMDPAPPETGTYFENVREAVIDIPRTIGRYVGRDAEVAQAARELLRPNVILQRHYARLDGEGWFSLVVVHCGDARDMLGHYPPICYPNIGWRLAEGAETTLDLPGRDPIPARRYEMQWPHDRSREDATIFNFFAVPNERTPFAADMETLRHLTRTRGTSAQGAAQVQVLFPASMGAQEREEILMGLIPELERALDTVVEGPDHAALPR